MAVDTQTVEKLAELARIAISNETIEEVSGRLGDILQLVDQLQAVNILNLVVGICAGGNLRHAEKQSQRVILPCKSSTTFT